MKNILVTGAKGNLGTAVVNKFLDSGYCVIGTVSAKESTVTGNKNTHLEYYSVDLTDASASKGFIQSVIAKNKSIDGAVLTVGGFAAGKLTDTAQPDFEKMFALNFITAFNIVQPVLKQMMTQPDGGRIILIGSKPGMSACEAKGSVAYGLSKSLVFRLAEIINVEGKGKNIFASVIVPATIDTPQNRAGMPDANFSEWVKAEDIAAIIEFVFSEKAKSLRDEVIEVTGNS
ncbi:MAG TPA: SDR family NAD(P)-dependent oxidoreductase [Bacteroidia bacterium]|nr:SDR family NAD(P)-dependent oxidoreductase [Bacteroidia bacterium]